MIDFVKTGKYHAEDNCDIEYVNVVVFIYDLINISQKFKVYLALGFRTLFVKYSSNAF